MPPHTADEMTLLAMLKKMYWANAPQITKCQSGMHVSRNWPGRPDSIPALDVAMKGLVSRGYLVYSEQQYCLTDDGVRAIGAAPPVADPSEP